LRVTIEQEVNQMQREVNATRMAQSNALDWSARVYGRQDFAGAGKMNTGLLVPLERRLAAFVLPCVPRWLETYHLTLLTPVWSILIVVFGYLAARDLRWLWMANLMIVLHYFTDHFDGKLGKFRDTGLRKWGFYLDHLFDYGFLCAILIGYSFLIPPTAVFSMMLVLCVFGAFMFHTSLMLTATEEFCVSFSKLGPTEMRIGLIVINALLIPVCFVLIVSFIYLAARNIHWLSIVSLMIVRLNRPGRALLLTVCRTGLAVGPSKAPCGMSRFVALWLQPSKLTEHRRDSGKAIYRPRQRVLPVDKDWLWMVFLQPKPDERRLKRCFPKTVNRLNSNGTLNQRFR